MRITYDAQADAVYIYLTTIVHQPIAHQVDEDILLDLDDEGRVLGIEVLAASKRLDMEYLMPFVERIDKLPDNG